MPGLRVIGGSARGVGLRQPRGRTRPTAARLRESLFSMLEAAGVDFRAVLDLYAGSGALGIEALSRGAGRCIFVEADRRAATVIHENLARTGLAGHARVVVARVGRWRAADADEAPFTLVLADPPYHDPGVWTAIEATLDDALAPDAVVAVEHAARDAPPGEFAGRALARDRRQGEGAVAIYESRREDAG